MARIYTEIRISHKTEEEKKEYEEKLSRALKEKGYSNRSEFVKEKIRNLINKEELELKIYYEDILVGDVLTNRSMTVDEALNLIGFNEEEFIAENGFDDIDYNDFRMEY